MINVKRFFHELVYGKPPELPSPVHRIFPSQILAEDYKVGDKRYKRLNVAGLPLQSICLPNPHNTDSMDGPGLIDKDANLLLSWDPDDIDQVLEGDIIAWRLPNGLARMHQIYYVGSDNEGWYCRTRGVNLAMVDPFKIRKGNITYVLLGILF